MFEGNARVFATPQSSCEMEGTRHQRARRSGVFLCFVSLDGQRNEGAERGRNPATLGFINQYASYNKLLGQPPFGDSHGFAKTYGSGS